jgi:hypothetical protein
VGDLDRADVNVLFLVGEGDSAGGESDDAKEDKNYSDNCDWLHGAVAFREQIDGMPLSADLDVPATVFPQALVDNSNQE